MEAVGQNRIIAHQLRLEESFERLNMVMHVSGKEDEKLQIIFGLDFIVKAGKGVYQASAFRTLPLDVPNEREESIYIPNNPVIAQNGQQ